MKKTILILAANPEGTARLRIDKEIRSIKSCIERSTFRDRFEVRDILAATPADTRRAMLDYDPVIVHFSGHGEGSDGLLFESASGRSHSVSTKAISDFFQFFANRVECVILNACMSEVQAKSVSKHITHVIGMKAEISDEAALQFSEAFYDAVAANRDYESAFKIARNAISWANLPEDLTPSLKKKKRLKSNAELASVDSDDRSLQKKIPNIGKESLSKKPDNSIGTRTFGNTSDDISQSLKQFLETNPSIEKIIDYIWNYRIILDSLTKPYPIKFEVKDLHINEDLIIPDFTLIRFKDELGPMTYGLMIGERQLRNMIVFASFLPLDLHLFDGDSETEVSERVLSVRSQLLSLIDHVQSNERLFANILYSKSTRVAKHELNRFLSRTIFKGVIFSGRRDVLSEDQITYITRMNNSLVELNSYDSLIDYCKFSEHVD